MIVIPRIRSVISLGSNNGSLSAHGVSGTLFTEIAGEALSGGQVVKLDSRVVPIYTVIGSDVVIDNALDPIGTLIEDKAFKASSSIFLDINKVIGLTTGAAIEGDLVTILREGEIEDPSWSWTLDMPIYLGLAGAMTQTPPVYPTNLFSLMVAYPITATKVFFYFRNQIILS